MNTLIILVKLMKSDCINHFRLILEQTESSLVPNYVPHQIDLESNGFMFGSKSVEGFFPINSVHMPSVLNRLKTQFSDFEFFLNISFPLWLIVFEIFKCVALISKCVSNQKICCDSKVAKFTRKMRYVLK